MDGLDRAPSRAKNLYCQLQGSLGDGAAAKLRLYGAENLTTIKCLVYSRGENISHSPRIIKLFHDVWGNTIEIIPRSSKRACLTLQDLLPPLGRLTSAGDSAACPIHRQVNNLIEFELASTRRKGNTAVRFLTIMLFLVKSSDNGCKPRIIICSSI